jgi:hypothetical protein
MGIVEGLEMVGRELFKPSPEKYRHYGHEPHWRGAAEDLARLMEAKHQGMLTDSQIDILGHGMRKISDWWDEDKVERNSRFSNISEQLRNIKDIYATAVRLRTFAQSVDNEAIKRTLEIFYSLDPANEARDLEMLVNCGPDDEGNIAKEWNSRPEWIYALAPKRDQEFRDWLTAAPAFVTALDYARRQLELTEQYVSIESELIGEQIPELYHKLYGEVRGGRQGGETLRGPFYTFVAEVVRLTTGLEKSAAAIRAARKRRLKKAKNATPV